MLRWLERRWQRQRELQQGVDADLVRDNRRRWKLTGCLFACGFALLGIQSLVTLRGSWHDAAVVVTLFFFGAGLVLGQWSRAEQAFLDRPDPKEPPKLWK
jgi:hypothetical protein